MNGELNIKRLVVEALRQNTIAEMNRAAGRNWAKLEDAFSLCEKEGILVARYIDECGCCAAETLTEMISGVARPASGYIYYPFFCRVRKKLVLHCLPAGTEDCEGQLFERAIAFNQVDELKQKNLCLLVLELLNRTGLHAQIEDSGWIMVSGKWPELSYENSADPHQGKTGK